MIFSHSGLLFCTSAICSSCSIANDNVIYPHEVGIPSFFFVHESSGFSFIIILANQARLETSRQTEAVNNVPPIQNQVQNTTPIINSNPTPNVNLNIQNEFTDTVRATHSHASRPIETLHKSYTPPYIHKLIEQKNQYRNLYHRTLGPHYKTLYNKAQKNIKKELRNYSNENWTAKLQALSTKDNSLWAVQKFLKNKRSDIPPLNCTAVRDNQKANILADSILDNFTENTRHNNDFDDDDELTNNTVNSFLSIPPTTTDTAYPSKIISYIKKSNSKKAPGKDGISNYMTKNFTLKAILILTILINKILTLNYFPKPWKEAIIFPILKPAVMRPILAYGYRVWGYAAKTNINILDTLQNSTIRMIVKATNMRNDN
ncbi:putative RNA-directed DNA polymerase from transposon X-element [Trichonephila clavipes]|nr:putative RNA-directed DNA polymerase from transposon X-element [Trichonephila clavipes]